MEIMGYILKKTLNSVCRWQYLFVPNCSFIKQIKGVKISSKWRNIVPTVLNLLWIFHRFINISTHLFNCAVNRTHICKNVGTVETGLEFRVTFCSVTEQVICGLTKITRQVAVEQGLETVLYKVLRLTDVLNHSLFP